MKVNFLAATRMFWNIGSRAGFGEACGCWPASLTCVRRYRFLLAPRWLAWHALMIVVVVAFLYLGRWQLSRAFAGNMQSFAYAIEWPIFAGFVIFFWYRTIHGELHPEKRPDHQQSSSPPAQTDVGAHQVEVAGSTVRLLRVQSAVTTFDDQPDPAMDAYNDYLAALNADPKPS